MKETTKKPKSGVSYRSPIKITSELLWQKLLENAELYAKGSLIDLGCGLKPYEKIFSPYVSTYLGIDWETASASHYGASTRADLYVDCTDTKLDSNSFDTLLSTQVMEHIYDTRAYLIESHRLLRVGGVGIFTVPLLWEEHGEPYDFFRFTKHGLRSLFTENGFSIESIQPVGGAYAALIQAKIVSVHYRPVQNLVWRIFRRVKNELMIPILNFMALKLDRYFWNEKLCINYLVIVKKSA